jgi:hypothetical protein
MLIDFVGLVTTDEAGVVHIVDGVEGTFVSEEWPRTSLTGEVGCSGTMNGPGREYDDLCRPTTLRQ